MSVQNENFVIPENKALNFKRGLYLSRAGSPESQITLHNPTPN
jgi:hypothetical protein